MNYISEIQILLFDNLGVEVDDHLKLLAEQSVVSNQGFVSHLVKLGGVFSDLLITLLDKSSPVSSGAAESK